MASESENIKLEIYQYGPVVVTIPVYRDFLIYKEGLYQVYPKNQKFSADHAVKIIGWDLIDGKNAWIIENSWGADWGVNGTAYFPLYIVMSWQKPKNSTSNDSPWPSLSTRRSPTLKRPKTSNRKRSSKRSITKKYSFD